jgi:hypothetical protein
MAAGRPIDAAVIESIKSSCQKTLLRNSPSAVGFDPSPFLLRPISWAALTPNPTRYQLLSAIDVAERKVIASWMKFWIEQNAGSS